MNYKGAVIRIDKMIESESFMILSLEDQISNIYRNKEYDLNQVLNQHKKTYGVPLILIIDNIQRLFTHSKTHYDLSWFTSLTVYLDAGLLKVMVVSSEYDVYYSIKTLSNTWFSRVIEYRMPIFSEINEELKSYLLSKECREAFCYDNLEKDVEYVSKFFGNQFRFYLPLLKERRNKISFEGL